jgi:hypothetical protein
MGVNHKMEKQVNQMFSVVNKQPVYGQKVYKGYVDDERATDHAWMVTQAYLFEKDDVTTKLTLRTGDPTEVAGARWLTYPCGLTHANHVELVKLAYSHYPFRVRTIRLAKFMLLWTGLAYLTRPLQPLSSPVEHAKIDAVDNLQCRYLNETQAHL